MRSYATKEGIENARAQIVARHGEWTAHDIRLAHGITTMGKGLYQQWRVDYFHSLIEKYSAHGVFRPGVSGKRLLDLACLEGLFSVEFARKGVEVLGIEIREAHLAKARFAAEVNCLANCKFVQDDVRNLAKAKYGAFDVVVCAGILYHLDFPDCIRLLHSVCDVCRDIALIDTHVAMEDRAVSVLPLGPMADLRDGRAHYRGRPVMEHAPTVTEDAKRMQHPWASIDNPRSVWLTKESIASALNDVGFDVCYTGFPDGEFERRNPDRVMFVAKRRK